MLRILQQFILSTIFAVFASHASAMFIQADWLDPSDPTVGTNRYSYSFNDPVNLSDPNGNHIIQDSHGDYYNDYNDNGVHDIHEHTYVGNDADGTFDWDREIGRDDQRDDNNGRYDPTEYYSGSFGNDIANGNYNPSALSPIHPNNGQAMSADSALYGIATLPAGVGVGVGKGIFGLITRTAPVARSLSAAATPTTLQTGGRTLSNRTVKALNERFGTKLSKGEWGRALEDLKKDAGLRNDFHGKIFSDGSYGSSITNVLGNISHYLP